MKRLCVLGARKVQISEVLQGRTEERKNKKTSLCLLSVWIIKLRHSGWSFSETTEHLGGLHCRYERAQRRKTQIITVYSKWWAEKHSFFKKPGVFYCVSVRRSLHFEHLYFLNLGRMWNHYCHSAPASCVVSSWQRLQRTSEMQSRSWRTFNDRQEIRALERVVLVHDPSLNTHHWKVLYYSGVSAGEAWGYNQHVESHCSLTHNH